MSAITLRAARTIDYSAFPSTARAPHNRSVKKVQTLEQVRKTKKKAVRFVRDVLGDNKHADELEDETPESYAQRKRVQIVNPKGKPMPRTRKDQEYIEQLEQENQDLRDQVDAISDIVNSDEEDDED